MAMESTPTSRSTGTVRRTAAMVVVAGYAAVVVALAVFARPLSRNALIGIALLPAAVAFLFGLPMVWRGKPRRLMAIFHLIVYPLLAAITLGLPGVLIAWQLAEFLEA